MASIPEVKSVPCQFVIAWKGPCNKPTTNGWCDKHENAQCSSCGEKATRDCGETSGAICCSSYLCDTCKHSLVPNGPEHVTKAAYDEQVVALRAEEEEKERSRTSKERRLHPKTQLPITTFELLKGDWKAEGYELTDCFYIHIDHGKMGFHPALVISRKGTHGVDSPMIFTVDRALLVEFWKLLPPSKSKIDSQLGYVHTGKKVLYPYHKEQYRQEVLEPQPLFDRSDLDELRGDPKKNFDWAPLVIGCAMSADDFQRMIERSELQPV